jgi:deoxyribonuclease V
MAAFYIHRFTRYTSGMCAIAPHERPAPEELRRLQETLAQRVRLEPLRRQPATAAGVDAAYLGDEIIAVAALVDLATLAIVERSCVIARPTLPYIPGLLAFREGPHLAEAVRRLSRQPDLLIVDGQGIAHPKRFGLACYLGVELGLPAIGSAKSRLVGEYAEPAAERGSRTPLFIRHETVGAVLRTRSNVRPVFVSPGHLITIDEAVAMELRATAGFRLPEPQREADRFAAEIKRRLLAGEAGGIPDPERP